MGRGELELASLLSQGKNKAVYPLLRTAARSVSHLLPPMGSNAAGEGSGALPKTGWFAGSGRRQRARSLAVGRSVSR